MKVYIDAQSISGKKTGIGIYTENLMSNLMGIDGLELVPLSYEGKDGLGTAGRIYWENLKIPVKINKRDCDILHIPGFAGPRYAGVKKVTTVHDLIGMIYPMNLSAFSRFYWQKWLPACVKGSDMIIADSENTKNDIIRLLDVPREKIKVILLAADAKFNTMYPDKAVADMLREKYGLPEEFMLTVGTVEPRKNLPGLVEAAALYRMENKKTIDIVIAGDKGWGYEQLMGKVRSLGMEENVKITGYLEEEELPVMYKLAKFFVYPSFYEGFGLPVLEAMSCGTPVICSSASSLPEITGDAGILVDPDDVPGLKNAIKEMDGDPGLRKEFSGKGILRAKRFSWRYTAEETYKVYKEVFQ